MNSVEASVQCILCVSTASLAFEIVRSAVEEIFPSIISLNHQLKSEFVVEASVEPSISASRNILHSVESSKGKAQVLKSPVFSGSWLEFAIFFPPSSRELIPRSSGQFFPHREGSVYKVERLVRCRAMTNLLLIELTTCIDFRL